MTPDKAVRTAKEMKAHKRLPDPAKEGLWLSIGKTGTVRWEARVRVAAVGGAPRWIGLGRYPGDAGLAVARHRCDAVRVAARAGADLHTLRRMFETPPTPPEPSPSSPTDPACDSLAAKVKIYERQGDPGKSWPHRRKRIDRVFKAQLLQSVNALTTVALQEAADTYPARQSAAFAVRTLRPALRWLAKRQHCPAELAAIEQPVTVQKRERRLSRAELAAVLPVLNDGPVAHGRCLRFILLTACRLNEALEARWRDIDWQQELWTIPETKSGIEHVLPLSRQAIALLRHHRPGDADPDARIFTTASGHTFGNWGHDLRRSSATAMDDIGTEPHVIESVMDHVDIHTGLSGIYNRSRYRPEMATALQRLADLLDTIEAGKAQVAQVA